MNDKNIESILVEQRSFPPSAEFTSAARLNPENLAALYDEAAADHEGYWAARAREELDWATEFRKPWTRPMHPTTAGLPTAN